MKQSADKVFHTIARLSADADWTEEELKDAIRQEGGDPDEFLGRTMPRITSLIGRLRDQESDQVKGGVSGTPHVTRVEVVKITNRVKRGDAGTVRQKRSGVGKLPESVSIKRKGDRGNSPAPKKAAPKDVG
jgi:hypothetical protein